MNTDMRPASIHNTPTGDSTDTVSGPSRDANPATAPANWWRLVRGGNALLSGAAALVGVHLSGGEVLSLVGLLAAMAPILITAAGNVDNDLRDLAIDRISKSHRPLVTGVISADAARAAAIVLSLAGMGAALIAGPPAFVLAVGVIVLLLLYNRFLAGVAVMGNLAIAALGALPILYGGVCVGGMDSNIWIVAALGAVIAFWLHLSREILKDVLDIEGDAALGRRTLPIVLSPEAAIRLAALPMIPAAGFTLWLGLSGQLSILYLFGVAVTIVPALLLGAAQCVFNPGQGVALRWAIGLKLLMAAGLIWMVLGKA